MTEAQSGPRLSTLCNQCRADTDRCSIGSTVSGRPHELRLSFKNTAHRAYLHGYCPSGTPPTGSTHETSPAGTCSKAAFVWRVCVINVPLLRLNLEPSAADRNVSPSLHIIDARYGTTYIHSGTASRRLQVESQQWYIDHANTPHECSFGTGVRRRSLMCPPRRGSAPRAIVMNVRPMGSVL